MLLCLETTSRLCSGEPSRITKEPVEPTCFEDLWNLHADALHRSCLRWVSGRRDLADEALSRCSLVALRQLRKNRHRIKNVRSWLFRVAKNACMDLYRERKRKLARLVDETFLIDSTSPQYVEHRSATPEYLMLQGELIWFLCQEVRFLRPRLRETLELRAFEGLDYQEIAERLSISRANVRKRMQEARVALRARLRGYAEGKVRLETAPGTEDKRARKT